MEVTPAAAIVLPLIAIASLRRRWLLAALVGLAPFQSLTIVTALSHKFSPSEIVLLVLISKQAIKWLKHGSMVFEDKRVYGWLILFGMACVVSVGYAAVRPASVLVHPYNVGGFGGFVFEVLSFSTSNITQLFLRLFFVVGVFIIAQTIQGRTEIRQIVRWLILTGLLVGSVGVIYQISIITNFPLADILRWTGFRFSNNPTFSGPFPRMYSLPGEPGFTADYLLFTLALSVTLFLYGKQNGVLSRRESGMTASLLFLFLLLSTGTTGYGGLVILGGVLFMYFVTVDSPPKRALEKIVAGTFLIIPVGMTTDILLFQGELRQLARHELEKLMFQAGSGTIRLQYMTRTIDVVWARPLIGVGVGSHHVPSMLFTLLAEVGIIGLFAFIGFHVSLYRRCGWFAFYDRKSRINPLALTLFIAGVTLFFTNLIAKSVSTLLFPWYWLSLALPLALIGQRQRVRDADYEN